jgi:hypothetical protein
MTTYGKRVVLAGVVVLSILAHPAHAAVPPKAPPPVSPWSGPWRPSVREADVQRFVGLWEMRVHNAAWMSSFVSNAEISPEVAVEGYHDLDAHTKRYLTSRLADRLGAAADREKDLLHLFVFDHSWVRGLRDAWDAKPPAPEPAAAARTLDPKIEAMRTPRTIAAPPASVPQRLRPRELRAVTLSGPPAPAPVATVLAPEPAPPRPRVEAAPSLPSMDAPAAAAVPAFSPPSVTVPAPHLGLPIPDVGAVLDATTYVACAESPSMAQTCSAPTLIGVPVSRDVDGNGTSDVQVSLVPAPDPAHPAAFGVAIDVSRLSPAGALPAHVFAVFGAPTASKRIALGFDGRASTLAADSQATFRLPDPVQALTGLVGVDLDVSHSQPGADSSVTLAIATHTSDPPADVDPMITALRFVPVPSSVSLGLVFDRSAGHDEVSLSGTPSSTTVMTASARMDDTSVNSRRTTSIRFEPLVAQTEIGLAVDTLGTLTTALASSAPIAKLAYSDQAMPSLTDPGTYRLVKVEEAALPTQLQLAVDPSLQTTYSANGVLGSAKISMDDFASGERVRALSVRAVGVPESASVTTQASPEGTKVTLAANAATPELGVSMLDTAGPFVAGFDITAVPANVEVSVLPAEVRIDASAAMGSMSGSLSTKSAPVVAFAGDHVSVKRIAGGTGLGFRLAGVRNARVAMDGAVTSASVDVPAGKPSPLRVHYEDASATVDATVPSLPSHMDAAVNTDTGRVAYNASAGVQSLLVETVKNALTASVLALTVPKSFVVAWDPAHGGASLTADAAIGLVQAKLSVAHGTGGSVPGSDYLVARKDGPGTGIDVKLAHVKAFLADPVQGSYNATFAPGGQPFTATADLDGDYLGSLVVSALPDSLMLHLDHAGKTLTYLANAVVPSVAASAERHSTGAKAIADLTNVPGLVTAAWTTGLAPVVTTTTTGAFTAAHLYYRESASKNALDVTAGALPKWLQVQVATDRVSVDARTGPGAPQGSSAVGSLLLKYASNANLTGPSIAEDHAWLGQSPAVTQAELKLTAMKFASVDARFDALHATLTNASSKPFRILYNTPTSYTDATILDLPASVTLDYDGAELITYTASAPIDTATLTFNDLSGTVLSAAIEDVPASAQIQLDLDRARIAWASSAPVTSLTLGAAVPVGGRTWNATLSLDHIPAAWSLSLEGGKVAFDSSGAIFGVDAKLTNHGTVTVPAGPHASVMYDAPTGDLDGSFRMLGLKSIDVEHTDASTAVGLERSPGDLYAAQVFGVNVDLRDAAGVARITGTLDKLPSQVSLQQAGDRTIASASQRFDLNVHLEIGGEGGVSAAPDPPVVHGLAIRDGKHCTFGCATGIKANLFLTGFPADLVFDPTPPGNFGPAARIVDTREFTPTQQLLAFDAAIDDIVPVPVQIVLVQRGVAGPVDIGIGPVYASAADGVRTVRALLEASKNLGSLEAEAIAGPDVVQIHSVNVPRGLDVRGRWAYRDTSFQTTLTGAQANYIFVSYRRTADPTAQGFATLTDVPEGTSTLEYGSTDDADGNAMPFLDYASSADSLDVTAFVEATLFDGDVKGKALLQVTNLGHATSAKYADQKLSITSSPFTSRLEIHVWARIKYMEDFSECYDSCDDRVYVQVTGHAGVEPLTVDDLMLRLTDFSTVTVAPGLTSSVGGTFGSVAFGWDDVHIKPDVEARIMACVVECFKILPAFVYHPGMLDVDVLFHVYGNHPWNLLTLETGVIICDDDLTARDIVIDLRPHPHFTSWNGFEAGAPEGGSWLLMPNPGGAIPAFVMNLVAAATSPEGNGISITFPCQ